MVEAAFEIELKRSGRVLHVPANKSILEVLQENGFYVMYSCLNGVCGTCLTRLVSGLAEHRDEYQSDEEKAANRDIAVCVSRSAGGRLVIDL